MRNYLFPQIAVLLFVFVSSAFGQTGGSLDPTFGNGGKVAFSNPLVIAVAGDLEVQSDRKFVALTGPAGGLDSTYSLIRMNLDGSIDSGFGSSGTVSRQWGLNFRNSFYFGYVRAIAIQNIAGTERIIMAGPSPRLSGNKVSTQLRIDRFMPNGTIDASFGTNGTAYLMVGSELNDIAIQSDQKIVGVSRNTSELFRLTPNGALDNTFGTGGKVTSPDAYKVVVDVNATIVVGGWVFTRQGNTTSNKVSLRRHSSAGSIVSTFGTNGVSLINSGFSSFRLYGLALDPFGNIIVGARADVIKPNGDIVSDLGVARVSAAGFQDTSFSGDGIATAGLTPYGREAGVVVQYDGKIILTGHFGDGQTFSIDGVAVRYNFDGSLDASFGTGGSAVFNITGNDYVGNGKGGIIQIDPFCACEKLIIAAGNDHLTTFARLTL